jgi:hypothetical protein
MRDDAGAAGVNTAFWSLLLRLASSSRVFDRRTWPNAFNFVIETL